MTFATLNGALGASRPSQRFLGRGNWCHREVKHCGVSILWLYRGDLLEIHIFPRSTSAIICLNFVVRLCNKAPKPSNLFRLAIFDLYH